MKEFLIELLQAVATAAVVQTAASQGKPVGGADSPVEGGEPPVI